GNNGVRNTKPGKCWYGLLFIVQILDLDCNLKIRFFVFRVWYYPIIKHSSHELSPDKWLMILSPIPAIPSRRLISPSHVPSRPFHCLYPAYPSSWIAFSSPSAIQKTAASRNISSP